MKQLTYFAVALLLTFGLIILIDACKKNNNENQNTDEPIYSETGEATVGPAGGTIKVVDENSPINGASIEIPTGALNKDVFIQIKEFTENVYLGEGINPKIVQFLPAGLSFLKPVKIGVPFSSDEQNSSNSQLLYLVPKSDSLTIDLLPILDVNIAQKIVYGEIIHFSDYFTINGIWPEFEKDVYLMTDQILSTRYFTGDYENLKVIYQPSTYKNIEEVLNNEQNNYFTDLIFLLAEKTENNYNNVAFVRYQIHILYETGKYNVEIKRIPKSWLNDSELIYQKNNISFVEAKETWISGLAIDAIFKNDCFYNTDYELKPDSKYRIISIWGILSITPAHQWSINWVEEKSDVNINELTDFENDQNQNCIVDIYENLENSSPSATFAVLPPSGTTETIFEFDASSCSDLEDSVDELLVRWDFDGDGTWDTDWDMNKIESHQYSSEDNFNAHLEVRDTEGLTDSESKMVYVSDNIGGGEPCPGTPTVTDADGNVYNTVQIGNQCWMKENLNVGIRIDGNQEMTDNDIIEKYCYDNDQANCDIYGGLYGWYEMMQYATQEGTQGICPEGWHIPTEVDLDYLSNYLGGSNVAGGKLKEKGTFHWESPNEGATNESGFTGLPSGGHVFGGFSNLRVKGYFWTSSINDEFTCWGYHLYYNNGSFYSALRNNTDSYPLRCIKD